MTCKFPSRVESDQFLKSGLLATRKYQTSPEKIVEAEGPVQNRAGKQRAHGVVLHRNVHPLLLSFSKGFFSANIVRPFRDSPPTHTLFLLFMA